jgi:hypothetical protein
MKTIRHPLKSANNEVRDTTLRLRFVPILARGWHIAKRFDIAIGAHCAT